MTEGQIRIEHKTVAGRHVFTSPDMPEFYVSHEDLTISVSEIAPVMQALRRLRGEALAVVVPKLVELEAG